MDLGRRYHWPKLVGFAAMEVLIITTGVLDYSALPHFPTQQNRTEVATCTSTDQLFERFCRKCMRSAGKHQHAAVMMLHFKVMPICCSTRDVICAPQHNRRCNIQC